ncbi:LiaI-LiaF-like domain-containing protein [Patescibacteria group bacterium]
MFFPLVLISLGVIFLLKNLGYISTDTWDVLWPILIIAAGISFLLGKFRAKRKFHRFCDRIEDYDWDEFGEKMKRKFTKFEEEMPDEIKVEMKKSKKKKK